MSWNVVMFLYRSTGVHSSYPIMEDCCIMKRETLMCLFVSLRCLLHLAPYAQVRSCFALKMSNHMRPVSGRDGVQWELHIDLAYFCLLGKKVFCIRFHTSKSRLPLETSLRDCCTTSSSDRTKYSHMTWSTVVCSYRTAWAQQNKSNTSHGEIGPLWTSINSPLGLTLM